MGGELPPTSVLDVCDPAATLIEAILASTSNPILSRPPAVPAETAQRRAIGKFSFHSFKFSINAVSGFIRFVFSPASAFSCEVGSPTE
jgi:hypothetical protein